MGDHTMRNGAEVLADNLSQCADAIHERVVKAIKAYEGRDVPASEQAALRTLWDQELVLRQRANGLYAEVAAEAIATLGEHRDQLGRVTGKALEKIKTITKVGDAVGEVAAGLVAECQDALLDQPHDVLAAIPEVEDVVDVAHVDLVAELRRQPVADLFERQAEPGRRRAVAAHDDADA